MNEYQILARKYRPQKFTDVVAQSAIIATLKNAIRMRRTAHAYLFCGCRGTGKTTLARLFAKALNCTALLEEIEPCNQCSSCREIAASHAIDVLEIDGASHRGIEDIRQINESIGFTPTGGVYKIYLIDEVHMLTKEAFNALLKTLEEPPAHVKFFFCTTEAHRIPTTILSRCQKFNLGRIPDEKIVSHLSHIGAENRIDVEDEALMMIAKRAEGSLRDALSLFDQIIAFEKGRITAHTASQLFGIPPKELLFSLDKAGMQGDIMAAFRIAEDVFCSGHNLAYFLEELILHFRNLLLAKQEAMPMCHEYRESSSCYRSEQLIQILEFLIEGQQQIKSAPSERVALEMLLLKVIHSHKQLSLESLVDRLSTLEQRLANPVLESTSVSHPSLHKEIPVSKESALIPNVISPNEVISIQEQSRFDTIMRFAAKELNAVLIPKQIQGLDLGNAKTNS